MKQIYYIGSRYPEKRCIINQLPDYKYIEIDKEKSLLAIWDKYRQKLRHHISANRGEKALSIYKYVKRKGVIHTFNACIDSNTPWICNFETIIPRTNCTRGNDWKDIDEITLKAVKLLAKESCLQCFALSNAALKIEMEFLKSISDKLTEKELRLIQGKLSVLHPPQKVMIMDEELEEKFQADEIKFIFVGHDFFRKGGKEVLDVLMKLKKRYHFHLTVISKLNYNDYASGVSKKERDYYYNILKKEDWITYYESLDNREVLKLCKTAHIGLLPTFADTYGYSVLEMQACGCVMVTTDIRALPELNNNDCGYICNLPQNNLGEALYQTDEERKRMKEQLVKNLSVVLGEILETNMKLLLKKAIKSVRKIEADHSPEKYEMMIRNVIESNAG